MADGDELLLEKFKEIVCDENKILPSSRNMNEESICSKGILTAITELRALKRLPDSEKFVSVVTRKVGLDAIGAPGNLDFLLESGAVVNKRAAKGKESIYIFDMYSFIAGTGNVWTKKTQAILALILKHPSLLLH